MNDSSQSSATPSSEKASGRPAYVASRRLLLLGVVLFAAAVLAGIRNLYPFLAVSTQRVPAQILVVEGWIYDDCFDTAAVEFNQGQYKWLATSGLVVNAPGATNPTYAHRAAKAVEGRGIPSSKILVCADGSTDWQRTSTSALAVYDFLKARDELASGINVVNIGSHARQSWLACRRIFGPKSKWASSQCRNKGLTQTAGGETRTA